MAGQGSGRPRTIQRWLLLGAFSAGLCIGPGQRWRLALGALGLLVTGLGLLFSLCCRWSEAAEAERRGDPRDLHEAVVAETFDALSPLEAAALVGVLHETRIARKDRHAERAVALELHAALDLVARASGIHSDRLHGLYRGHWRTLRGTVAPGQRRRLAAHPLVDRLVIVEEL